MITNIFMIIGSVSLILAIPLILPYDTILGANYSSTIGFSSSALTNNTQPVVEFRDAEQFLDYKEQLIASGSEFTEPLSISNIQTGNASDSVTARSGDLIFQAWVGDVNGSKNIYSAISFDNARSFTLPFKLSVNSIGDSVNPTVAIVNNTFWAAWENHANGVPNVMSSSSMDNGQHFIVYFQTNATGSTDVGSIMAAISPDLISPPTIVQPLNGNETVVTQSGWPLLTWLQTNMTENGPITLEYGHGRAW